MSSFDRQLMQIGLTNMQARMYVSLLQVGEASASELGKVSGINRVTSYTTLSELEEMGLVTADDYNMVRVFKPTDVANLELVFMKRAKQAIQSYREAQSLILDLKKLAAGKLQVPKTVYLEGQAAAVKYLSALPESEVLLGAYVNRSEYYPLLKPLAKRAADANARPQVIIPNSVTADLLVYLDHRVVPGKIAQFPATMLFFPHISVSLLQLDPMQLFSIEDERIAQQYYSVLTLNWRILSGHHLLVPHSESAARS